MINSGRFTGLEWLDEDKTVFKVPWIHAKKRGYNRERDAALFREWAMHSGKYRQDSDPTVWKINFRCSINRLKASWRSRICRLKIVVSTKSCRAEAKVADRKWQNRERNLIQHPMPQVNRGNIEDRSINVASSLIPSSD